MAEEETPLCCRCGVGEGELGGTYGGVVCKRHRVCQSCWWAPGKQSSCTENKTYLRGLRVHELECTRHIPLVDRPRKGRNPECFGCLYEMPLGGSLLER
jgi:hypothetical protein